MFVATLIATEDESATQAQVRALARQLAATCAPPTQGQYPCLIHERGRDPAVRHCVAVLLSSRAVTGRCSEGNTPPIVTSGYVDCATVGRTVTVSDPTGDVRRIVPFGTRRLVPALDPRADLVTVRVAATPTRFCADFRTDAPLSLGSWIGLDVREHGVQDVFFAPTVNWRDALGPQLQSPISSPIAGRLGFHGDWTSVVISADAAPHGLPHAPFQFSAYIQHDVQRGHDVRATTDSAPARPRSQTYP